MKNRNDKWQPKWVALPILDFTRVVRAFGDDSRAGFAWLQKFADDLILCNMESDDGFVRSLLEEARDYFVKRSNAGKLGGRPPKRPEPQAAGNDAPTPQQVYDFAEAEGLDEADARDWYEMTVVDRGGFDRNGNPIKNWKGALKRFCKNRAAKRSKGEVK